MKMKKINEESAAAKLAKGVASKAGGVS